MTTFYEDLQTVALGILDEFKQGTVSLIKVTTATPAPETPWEPGAETTATYVLSAAVQGVQKQYVDGETVVESDLQVVASARGRLAGVLSTISPNMTDRLSIDGAERAIKRIVQVPAAGTPITYLFFVAR